MKETSTHIINGLYKNFNLSIIFPFLLSLIIFNKGFGMREIYDVTICIFLAWSIFTSRYIVNALSTTFLLVLHFVFPGISLLWGFNAVLFSLNRRLWNYSILCLLLNIAEYFDILPTTFLATSACFLAATISKFVVKKIPTYIHAGLTAGAIVTTILSMPLWQSPLYAEKYTSSIYSPSEVYCQICNVQYADSTTTTPETRIIRETPFYTKIKNTQPGIFIHDVNSPENDSLVNTAVWQQPTSWHDNQMLGNQYYLEAIRHDGGLYSNKGITLKDNIGSTLLAFPLEISTSQNLVVKFGKTIYLHDSDYSSSYLANYQKCFLQELCGNTLRPNLIRIANILMMILYLAINLKNKYRRHLTTAIVVLILPLLCVVYFQPVSGEIRMIGEITNSHENVTFNGVPKKIIEAGYNYTIGDSEARILVVDKNHSATVRNEEVVIAEDDCRVSYNGDELKVINNPLGNVNGVTDARQWLYQGKLYDGKLKLGNTLFIATGSPALQSWKEILN